MSFLGIDIKAEYRSLLNDMTKEFYNPLLKESVLYKRAVGFFSSSALIEISNGIDGLVNNGGHIQLVVSPKLSEEDILAIEKGIELRDKIVTRCIENSIIPPKDEQEQLKLNLLSKLIANGQLDIKIALLLENNNIGMFHEKMGLLYDKEGNIIAFSGSMNESKTAFSHNYESIDVFCSWTFDLDRVKAKERAFKLIWEDQMPGIITMEFPDVAKDLLKAYTTNSENGYDDFTTKGDDVKEDSYPLLDKKILSIPENLNLREYQLQAIDTWEKNGFIGIFDMATGTGKTFTALAAASRLYNISNNKMALIIVCPYQHLVEQWVIELGLFNVYPIIGYSGSIHRDFKKKLEKAIFDFDFGIKNFFCFVCTNATFAGDTVQDYLCKLSSNTLLIVDEAHNFGAKKLRKTLEHDYEFKLALSATFERHNDIFGTQIISEYFGNKCIEYSLDEAIKNGMLCEYKYYPVPIVLSDEELEIFSKLSKEILKCWIIDKSGKRKLSEIGKKLAIKRARLVAGASMKVTALIKEIEQYKNDSHMLVYCGAAKVNNERLENSIDDIRQIDLITKKIWEVHKIKASKFTSEEDRAQRKRILIEFSEGEGLQALIAIKCLDEGINVPSIKIAFILASTTNPKEYIQRRGRVLRIAPNKEYAIIYDFITLPRPLVDVYSYSKEELLGETSLIKNEIKRMIEFKRLSKNPFDSDTLLNEMVEAYELFEEEIYREDEAEKILEGIMYDE